VSANGDGAEPSEPEPETTGEYVPMSEWLDEIES
jgi:hypothetical protein